jgi:hypothetical protein
MNRDGALLAMAGGDASVEKVIGALVSNIWATYDNEAAHAFPVEDLNGSLVFLLSQPLHILYTLKLLCRMF